VKKYFVGAGFSALTAQVIFLRELTVVFYGNEVAFSIILAHWLLAGGIGALAGSRLSSRMRPSAGTVGFLFILLGAIYPAALACIRMSRGFLGIPQGEVIGLSQMFAVSACCLALPAFGLGLLFPWMVEAFRSATSSKDLPTRGYLLEAAGSGLAGPCLSFVLLRYFSSSWILMGLGGLSALAGVRLMTKRPWGIWLGGIIFAAFLAGAGPLESFLVKRQWPGFEILENRQSPYGQLIVAQRDHQISFFENGFLMRALPGTEAREAAVHAPLSMHPRPACVLLAGESAPDYLAEILRHPVQRLVAVEFDPAWIGLKKKYAGSAVPTAEDSRVRIEEGDGRRYLKKTDEKFDVIILALPEPSTLLLNRFYTVEFYREAARCLAPGGILALQMPGMANYPGRELVEMLACVRRSLESVFGETVFLPLHSLHFLASESKGFLSARAGPLLESLEARGIRPQFFNENYLPFYLTPDRIRPLEERLTLASPVLDNRDWRPAAQFYTTLYWSSYASAGAKKLLRALMDLPAWVWFAVPAAWFLTLAVFARTRRGPAAAVYNAMAWTGASEIGFEMVILLAYQALYGYAYLWMAVILAGFMGGMVLGSARTFFIRENGARLYPRMMRVQGGIVFYPLLLMIVLNFAGNQDAAFHPLQEMFFPLLAVFAGFFGGLQFPLAQRFLDSTYPCGARETGLVYGVDLIGSCLGALGTGSLLVPVLGAFKVCLLLVWINALGWVLLALARPRALRSGAAS